ncbi:MULTISPECIES: TRAP transporter substrate-binding protein [unclassified Oceanispirochaeta]|uniref:TRAP transporter substrate-binding protein n=1 Tax=unclassified Oceanispirochaeta TaxID=2635722 RepID=UPI000E09BD2B|nr:MULTISPECIES: TRAP transporter substrate-binding protein [unclassified Oceanispirochaeta]MBF9018876.1 TRAP transporter substrate-binding protein [Oceanispirochaeta sp. M2]NPD75364.1 TRAP transporter substrate-binding protein [Oceanispirochaeta sp. M1]RDG28792.1 TRAP transporter substrate-binding protein DctP [Oceanispirochaeta sp. M1]
MKKSLVVLMMLMVFLSFGWAEGQKDSGSDETEIYTMKFGHSMPTETSRHQSLLKFKDYVEAESEGRIVVEIYPSGQLGKEAEMLEALKLGSQEGYLGGVFDSITPKLNLYLMPFLFADQEALMRFANSDLADEINKDAEQYGIKLLANGDAGSRNVTNNIRPVHTPADMVGLKMRTPPVEAIIKTMEALGANPVSIPYVEVYMALKTGVADGQENPYMNIATMKFQEVQKYMTVMHYLFNPEPFCVALDWFNTLPADLQKVVDMGADVYTESQNKMRADSSDEYLQIIKDAGVEVYTPTAVERKEFIDACAPVYEYYMGKGFFTQAELDKAISIASGK